MDGLKAVTMESAHDKNATVTTKLCSGFGKYHTNKGTRAKPLAWVTWEQIVVLVDEPPSVPKDEAQWLIPSTAASRAHADHERDGAFGLLWLDLDVSPPTRDQLIQALTIVGAADFVIYSSRSATPELTKWRVIVRLASPLSGEDWRLAQACMNDALEAEGIKPDRANEACGQLCYLPNRGAYYESAVQDGGDGFDALKVLATAMAAKREQLAEKAAAVEQRILQGKERREALKVSDALDLIGAFNLCYPPADIMRKAGYEQSGGRFRHPNSESGSFSASVKKDREGTERVHSLSSNDPLHTSGSEQAGGEHGAHDAFSAFTVLFHERDHKAALRDAGDNWLSIGDESWNTVKQREYLQKQNKGALAQSDTSGEAFDLSQYSMRGCSQAMKKKMLNDVYVLEPIALLGQCTVIYAKPNAGKTLLTLHLLREAVDSGRIDPEKVFYVNADDNYKGLVEKLELAEASGFHMLSPGHGDKALFKSNEFTGYLGKLVEQGTARGVVVVLDTLKKFTNLMDKKIAATFMQAAREFVSHGGTLILLAHTNKNRGPDGGLVAGGTSDVPDDADCVYTLDSADSGGGVFKSVFSNTKARGDVAASVAFEFVKVPGAGYTALLDSVKKLDSVSEAKAATDIAKRLEHNKAAIEVISRTLGSGPLLLGDLRDATSGAIPRRQLTTVLDAHTGDNFNAGARWRLTPGSKTEKRYELLEDPALKAITKTLGQ